MKYTKGEWKVKTSKAPRYTKAEVRTPSIIDDDGNAVEFGQLIAVCYGANTVANANLIASAPDLYEACLEFTSGGRSMYDPAYQTIFKAMAKAEGKILQ